ncbi:MAG: AbrB/MazE/SpoVT family DNA-binding domain-containing protein [Candidatus Bathyarchaeia archaeon]
MVTIPSALRKKYGVKEGLKVQFLDTDDGIPLIPITDLRNLFGVDGPVMLEAAKELEAEHRREAKGWKGNT